MRGGGQLFLCCCLPVSMRWMDTGVWKMCMVVERCGSEELLKVKK
jgi:hypothetical protein